MLEKSDISTEQKILKAAEDEFLTKGFAGAKTTEIAKSAGVNHAMLHYYFRTKENLFNVVFEKQIVTLANSFINVFEKDLPFFEKIQMGIEFHFDIIVANPKLPFFIFSEVLNNEERKNVFIETLLPKIGSILKKLQIELDEQAEKGNIRTTNAIDLMLTILSLNIFIFVAQPALGVIFEKSSINYPALLEYRKKINVEIIINSLKK